MFARDSNPEQTAASHPNVHVATMRDLAQGDFILIMNNTLMPVNSVYHFGDEVSVRTSDGFFVKEESSRPVCIATVASVRVKDIKLGDSVVFNNSAFPVLSISEQDEEIVISTAVFDARRETEDRLWVIPGR